MANLNFKTSNLNMKQETNICLTILICKFHSEKRWHLLAHLGAENQPSCHFC